MAEAIGRLIKEEAKIAAMIEEAKKEARRIVEEAEREAKKILDPRRISEEVRKLVEEAEKRIKEEAERIKVRYEKVAERIASIPREELEKIADEIVKEVVRL